MSKKYIIEQRVFPRSTTLTLTWSTEANSIKAAMENVDIGEDCSTIENIELEDWSNCDWGEKKYIKEEEND